MGFLLLCVPDISNVVVFNCLWPHLMFAVGVYVGRKGSVEIKSTSDHVTKYLICVCLA